MALVAVIVSGAEDCFLKEALLAERYFREQVNLRDITLIQGESLVKERTYEILGEVVERLDEGDALFLGYTGHGNEYGWALSDSCLVPYVALADLLVRIKSRLVIVNACCHAMSISVIRNIPSPRVSLIASCEADEVANQGLLADVMIQWLHRLIFSPVKVVHGGTLRSIAKEKEVVMGGFPTFVAHKLSLILNRIAPMRFSVKPICIKVVFLPSQNGEIEKESITYEGLRRGPVFDELFFPVKDANVRLPLFV